VLWGLSNAVLGAAVTQVTVDRTTVVTQGLMKSGLQMERISHFKETFINHTINKDTYLTGVLYHQQ